MTFNLFARLEDPSLIQTSAFVNGQWIGSSHTFEVVNPSTRSILCKVGCADTVQAQAAISAAAHAWPAWRGLTAKQRSTVLRDWFDLIMIHADDLASILSAEQGKPLRESHAEVAYGAAFVEWYAEQAKRVNGEVIPAFQTDRRLIVTKQSIGVCAAITPWNFPMAMITRKVAPALAAGCTVIVKPAEQTPLSALALAELGLRAGIPPGVLNILPADARQSVAIGKTLCESAVVRHLSFTGSTEVGRLLMAQCAPTVKKLALELGGNAPFIVFDDADLESAVAGAIASKFRNAGQTCVCANRIFVQSAIHDKFVATLCEAVHALKTGDAFDDAAMVGPLIDDQAVEKAERHITDAVSKGAQVVVGGKALNGGFFEPTVMKGANGHMLCFKEETFGPIAPLYRFDTEDQVVQMANDCETGLAGYLYTRDLGRAFRVAEALECGMVGVNSALISSEQVPFGEIGRAHV